MSGRLSISAVAHPVPTRDGVQFRGLMALLGGCELALVDLRFGRSRHSTNAKDHSIDKAIGALETALRDFRRGNGL